MKYYSEVTKQLYDSEDSLKEAEQTALDEQNKQKQLKEERQKRAKEVEEAFSKAYELRAKFIEDYGSFHQTYTQKTINGKSIFDVLFGD